MKNSRWYLSIVHRALDTHLPHQYNAVKVVDGKTIECREKPLRSLIEASNRVARLNQEESK